MCPSWSEKEEARLEPGLKPGGTVLGDREKGQGGLLGREGCMHKVQTQCGVLGERVAGLGEEQGWGCPSIDSSCLLCGAELSLPSLWEE